MKFPFSWDASSVINTTTSKTNCNDLSSNPRSNNSIYDLTSVVIHDGSANAGHYTCFSRNPTSRIVDQDGREKWIYSNDHMVSLVDESEVMEKGYGGSAYRSSGMHSFHSGALGGLGGTLGSRNAYMLLYIRRDLDEN